MNPLKNYLHQTLFIAIIATLPFTACDKSDETPQAITPVIDPKNNPTQYDAPFANVPANNEVAMYEVNIGVYSSAGNLKGVTEKLDSIKELGINTVWLMPIYSPGVVKSVGSPYCIKDYFEVNANFGTLSDLRELIANAHAKNMAVILDWVANHTAWDNSWIENKEWYTQDGNGNIIYPSGTNWQDVADLNYANKEMRQEMIKAMKYWILEANADGFRCDYANGVPTSFWKEAIDTLRNIPNRKLLFFAEGDKKELLTAGFDMMFGWPFYGKIKDVYNSSAAATGLIITHNSEYATIAQGKQIVRWVTNHDENVWDNTPSVIFKNNDGALTAFVVSTFMGGVPLIYSGQEVACPNKLPFFFGQNTKINWTQNADYEQKYKQIMAFRQASDAILNGTLTDFSTSDIAAFKRTSNTEEVVVLANMRSTSKTITLPTDVANISYINGKTNSESLMPASVTLGAYEHLYFKRQISNN